MAIKRSFNQRSLSNQVVQKQVWYQLLLVLALVPLLIGVLLVLTALTGARVWPTAWEQAIIGGLYILVSFVFSNLLQKQWRLAAGWLLLGTAVWLGMNWPLIEVKVGAAVLLGLSLALISGEFLRRRRQYLAEHRVQKTVSKKHGRK